MWDNVGVGEGAWHRHASLQGKDIVTEGPEMGRLWLQSWGRQQQLQKVGLRNTGSQIGLQREGKGLCRPLSPEDISQRLTAECSRKNEEDPCTGTMPMLPDTAHTIVPFLSRLPRSQPTQLKAKRPCCLSNSRGSCPLSLVQSSLARLWCMGPGQAVDHCSPTQPVWKSQLRTKRVQEI